MGPVTNGSEARLYALARRPTNAQFIKLYGPTGPAMTWAQRATEGVDATHFQEVLKAKGGGGGVTANFEALGRLAEGLSLISW